MKLPQAAKRLKLNIYVMAYKLNKEWEANGGTIFPYLKLNKDVNKITEEHSQFIKDYIEKIRTCIVRDIIR